MELVTLKFGRAQETEADVTGIRLLSDARIAPDGMIRFLNGSEKDKARVEIFSTHPMSAGRAERLKASWRRYPSARLNRSPSSGRPFRIHRERPSRRRNEVWYAHRGHLGYARAVRSSITRHFAGSSIFCMPGISAPVMCSFSSNGSRR